MHSTVSVVVRRWTAPLLTSAVLLISACGGGAYGGSTDGGDGGGGGITNPGTPIVTTAVSISGSSFVPPDIQVSPGATVTFTNNDGVAHNATFSSTAFPNTGDFATGSRSVTAPTTPGTYAYHCSIHAGMNGSVKVQ